MSDHQRTYVVTGSASGLGRATQKRIECRGGRVIGVDLRDADVIADLGSDDGRTRMVDKVGDLTGGAVDAVIACAGVSSGGNSPTTVLDVNFFGAVATLQGLRPQLARGRDPAAVAVISIAAAFAPDEEVVEACLAGDVTRARAAAEREASRSDYLQLEPKSYRARSRPQERHGYRAAKRALARWVRRAAPGSDWAGAGITLNGVAPGHVRTGMAPQLLHDSAFREETAQPLHWPGQPNEVAAVIAFLSSGENTLMTGQIIFVDGGREAMVRPDTAF